MHAPSDLHHPRGQVFCAIHYIRDVQVHRIPEQKSLALPEEMNRQSFLETVPDLARGCGG